MTEWTNYGDANPLEHGGIWVKKDEDNDTCFYIIKNQLIDGDTDKQQVLDLYVDTSDSWIEKKEVMDYIGMVDSNFDLVQFAIGAVETYSYDNFGSKIETGSKEETIKQLKEFGIDI